MHVAGEHHWTRSAYPLQLSTKRARPLSPVTSLAEAADRFPADRLPKDTQNSDHLAPFYRSVTDDRGTRDSPSQPGNQSIPSPDSPEERIRVYEDSSAAISTSRRSTSPLSASRGYHSQSGETEDTSATIQLSSGVENKDSEASHSYPPRELTETFIEQPSPIPASTPVDEPEFLAKKIAGPDQEGVPKRKLRRTPRSRRIESPIQSVVVEEALPAVQPTEQEPAIAAPGSNPWKRKSYPAQSIMADPPTQSSAPLSCKDKPWLAHIAPPSEPKKIKEASIESVSRDQGAKPLPTFTSSPTGLDPSPPLSENGLQDVNKISVHQHQNSNLAAQKNKRQPYPLQAPASNAALRDSLTPPPSPEREAEQTNDPTADQVEKNDQAAANRRRQLYPLQSPASIANLQRPQLPKIQVPMQEKDKPSTDQSREDQLARKVVQHWRRMSYPVQSPDNLSPLQRTPTPQPPEAEKYQRPEPIHLPKNIRAVNDAEKPPSKGRSIVVCLDGTGDKFDNDVRCPKTEVLPKYMVFRSCLGWAQLLTTCLSRPGHVRTSTINSNIVHLVSALKKDDPDQVTYYQAGIGTYGEGGLSGGVSAALDMAVGSSLGLHVRDAYHFLMHTYKEGDRICIFSFSRGAYTARCLAGMIHKVGLLPPRNIQQISFAYEFYKNDTPEGWKQSEDFKKAFCIDVCVYFIGCFDSVASVGIIPRTLPLSSTPTNKARYFRHAMALDERRAKFKVCRHQAKTWEEIEKGKSPTDPSAGAAASEILHHLPNYKAQDDAPPGYSMQAKRGHSMHADLTDDEYERIAGHEAPFNTDVLEVWFAGAHADIGGGAVPNDERHKLANIPLRWMIRQAFECNTGIIFKTKMLAEYGLDVHTLWPKYEKLSAPVHEPPPSYLEKYDKTLPPKSVRRSKLVPIDKHEKGEPFYHLQGYKDDDWTPEQVEDYYDAMTRVNDQLVDVPNWWILEFLPVQYKVPTAPGQAVVRTGMNLGRYRGVEDVEPNLHWTVMHRMKHMGYRIQARTAPHVMWRTVV